MTKHLEPLHKALAFTCPFCGAYAGMKWERLALDSTTFPVSLATCAACRQASYWRELPNNKGIFSATGHMIYPQIVTAPLPHPDLPPDLLADVEEARLIAANSPRGAAALLRLVIEKLVTELGAKGGTINDQIGDLVKKGLPLQVQQALDTVRVIGNNAVHAGKMDQADVEATVHALFGLVTIIVEQLITQPKKIAELFETLPEGVRDGIERRDGKPSERET